MRSKVRILLCTTVIAVVALTVHILIQDATRLPIRDLVIGCNSGGPYSGSVTLVAYLTALVSTFVAAVLYSYTGHLLPVGNRVGQSVIVGAILLELKGELIREPLVNYFYAIDCHIHQPLAYAVLSQMDKWLPNLIIAFLLVYMCPLKRANENRGRRQQAVLQPTSIDAVPV